MMLIYIPLMFITSIILTIIRIRRNPSDNMAKNLHSLFLSQSLTSVFFFQLLTPFHLVYMLMIEAEISNELLKSILSPTIYGGTISLFVIIHNWFQRD